MAAVDLVPGSRFRLHREAGGGTFSYICLATTLSLTTSRAAEETTTLDDRWATFLPGIPRWTLRFAGRVSPSHFALIEDDQLAGAPHTYRIVTDAPGGRTYTGLLLFETLTRGMTERGFLAFDAACRGSDVLIFT